MITESLWPNGQIQQRTYHPGSESLQSHEFLYQQSWHQNGVQATEVYQNRGDLSRIDGPAVIWWDSSGNIICEEYYRDGLFHRLGGYPAIIHYGEGKPVHQEYWEFGKTLSKSQIGYRKRIQKKRTHAAWLNQQKLPLPRTFNLQRFALKSPNALFGIAKNF